MPEQSWLADNPWLVPSLLGAVLFLQLLLFIAVAGISRKVSRLSRRTEGQGSRKEPESLGRKESNSDQKQWFAVFLDEDPLRKDLSKKEQFAEFRKWREERGLNWKG